jgi:hypothetical protein
MTTSEIREILDAEMWMHAVRLMRSGNYKTARQLIAAMEEDFQDVPAERIRNAMFDLAAKLRADQC